MQRSKVLLVALVACVLAGCSGTQVMVEHDPGADFSGFQTYDWLPVTVEAGGEARARDPILEARVRHAVDSELSARGYVLQETDPDFRVEGHVTTRTERIVSSNWEGRRYGSYSARRMTSVYEYEQGTLFLEISRGERPGTIWRGVASAEIFPEDPQDVRDKRIADAVRRMLEKFPPQ